MRLAERRPQVVVAAAAVERQICERATALPRLDGTSEVAGRDGGMAVERSEEPTQPVAEEDQERIRSAECVRMSRRACDVVVMSRQHERRELDGVAANGSVPARRNGDRRVHRRQVNESGSREGEHRHTTHTRRGMDQVRQDRHMIDERAFAGAEHLDPAYVAGYDRKTGFDVGIDVTLLQELGLDGSQTVVDLGAGTGIFAAAVAPLAHRVIAVDPSPAMLERARARGGFEVVEAGFLAYEHEGDAPQFAYSRNALHHLPDFWKGLALKRVHDLLAPGGVFELRDLVYCFEPDEADVVFASWFESAPTDARDGWTRDELEAHVRDEHSTFSWVLEPLLAHAGFEIDDRWCSESRTYARYVCRAC